MRAGGMKVSHAARCEWGKSTPLCRTIRWGLVVLLPVLIVGQLTTARAFAQAAEISGVVTDSSGARVPNANVTVLNRETGISRSVDSNVDGFYLVPLLQPGNYMITVKSAGFATQVRTGITLEVGAQQVLNLTLQVGQITQSLVVTSEAPIVQLASSSISAVINSNTVVDLPLNGRDWTQLATLQPGVVSLAALQPSIGTVAGNQRANRGFGAQLTVSGARPEQNNYRVDGISVNDYLNNSPGSAIGVALGVDAIQEFSVVTSNYSAEYGRTSGGVINAISRSGTNEFHGTAYEFLRNSALDARNFFDQATIPPFKRNQFGASGGAPIKKDKIFIFADYEGLRQSLGVTGLPKVPSQDARNGIIKAGNPAPAPVASCPAGTILYVPGTSNVCVDSSSAAFLAMYHLPTPGLLIGVGDTGFYSFVSQRVSIEDYVTTRIDYHLSDKDNLSGTYVHDNSLVTLPDVLNNVSTYQKAANQRVTLEENHTFSSRLINAARFGLNRVYDIGGSGLSAINPAAANPAFGAVPGMDATSVRVSGLTFLPGGVNDQGAATYAWTSIQAYDDMNLTWGRHNIKIGGDVERDRENTLNNTMASGAFQFGTLTAFLTNKPKNFNVTLPPIVGRYYRQTIFGAYAQDDIRLRPNLTINLGLRYEMSRIPTEAHDKLSNLYNVTDATPHIGNPFFLSNPTLRNFEPRVGFAWDPFGDGKTSIRSGFGLFDVLPLWYEYHINEIGAFPIVQSGQISNSSTLQGLFPAGALAVTSAIPKQRANYTQPNPKRNYVMQWNLSIQREVVPGLTLMTAYLGSHSIHNAFLGDDANSVLPTSTPVGYLWPCGPPVTGGSCTIGNDATGNAVSSLNQNFGRLTYLDWSNYAIYHALEGQVIKRFSHGLQLNGSYTWSKSIDGGSGTGVADPFSNTLPNLFPFEPQFNRGLSDYSVKHNLTIGYTWIAPKPKLANRAANWMLGGWELGGIFNVRSGLPFSVLIGGDPLGTNNSDGGSYPNRLTGSACTTAVNPGKVDYINVTCFGLPSPTGAVTAAQCAPFGASAGAPIPGTCANLQGNAGRNSLIGPGLINFDSSLFKNNYIGHSERFNLQFRAELFNTFNHTNFNSPTNNNTIFNEDGTRTDGAGLIDSTSTISREIQFALKFIW
jgi:hypothetical protein